MPTSRFDVTIEDDDERGFVLSKSSATVGEGDDTSYTVKLATQPTADVTVTLTPSGPAASDLTMSPPNVMFTTSSWNTAQTVTVSAANDSDADDETGIIVHEAAEGDYTSVRGEVAITVLDKTGGPIVTGATISPTTPRGERGREEPEHEGRAHSVARKRSARTRRDPRVHGEVQQSGDRGAGREHRGSPRTHVRDLRARANTESALQGRIRQHAAHLRMDGGPRRLRSERAVRAQVRNERVEDRRRNRTHREHGHTERRLRSTSAARRLLQHAPQHRGEHRSRRGSREGHGRADRRGPSNSICTRQGDARHSGQDGNPRPRRSNLASTTGQGKESIKR